MLWRAKVGANKRDSVIQLGIGLHKTMGMDVPGEVGDEGGNDGDDAQFKEQPAKMGRKSSLNLKGSSTGEIQRRSSQSLQH